MERLKAKIDICNGGGRRGGVRGTLCGDENGPGLSGGHDQTAHLTAQSTAFDVFLLDHAVLVGVACVDGQRRVFVPSGYNAQPLDRLADGFGRGIAPRQPRAYGILDLAHGRGHVVQQARPAAGDGGVTKGRRQTGVGEVDLVVVVVMAAGVWEQLFGDDKGKRESKSLTSLDDSRMRILGIIDGLDKTQESVEGRTSCDSCGSYTWAFHNSSRSTCFPKNEK